MLRAAPPNAPRPCRPLRSRGRCPTTTRREDRPGGLHSKVQLSGSIAELAAGGVGIPISPEQGRVGSPRRRRPFCLRALTLSGLPRDCDLASDLLPWVRGVDPASTGMAGLEMLALYAEKREPRRSRLARSPPSTLGVTPAHPRTTRRADATSPLPASAVSLGWYRRSGHLFRASSAS